MNQNDYSARQATFMRQARGVDPNERCQACGVALASTIINDGRCGECYSLNRVSPTAWIDKALQHDGQVPKEQRLGQSPAPSSSWDVKDGAVKPHAATSLPSSQAIIDCARSVSLRALQVIDHVLQQAQAAASKDESFNYSEEALKTLMSLAERADALADRVIAGEGAR